MSKQTSITIPWRVSTLLKLAVAPLPLSGGLFTASVAMADSVPVAVTSADEREAGKKLAAEGNFARAAEHYRKAADGQRKDADIWTEYGDVLAQLAANDLEVAPRN